MKYKLNFKRTTNKYSKEDLFLNIEKTWNFHKRQPTLNEMNVHPSTICFSTYYNHFGSWTNALMEFVKLKNNGKVIEEKPKITKHQKRKTLSKSLRYDIMKRDGFKCLICGKSPATSAAVELQIDHILPLTKGGKHCPSNLQTLCKDCNDGKSNK